MAIDDVMKQISAGRPTGGENPGFVDVAMLHDVLKNGDHFSFVFSDPGTDVLKRILHEQVGIQEDRGDDHHAVLVGDALPFLGLCGSGVEWFHAVQGQDQRPAFLGEYPDGRYK